MKIPNLVDGLLVLGLGIIAAGGFISSMMLGLFMTGSCCVVLAVLVERSQRGANK